jgi:hypothetical protein
MTDGERMTNDPTPDLSAVTFQDLTRTVTAIYRELVARQCPPYLAEAAQNLRNEMLYHLRHAARRRPAERGVPHAHPPALEP